MNHPWQFNMAVEHPACLDDFKLYRCSQLTWRFPMVFSNYQRVHLVVQREVNQDILTDWKSSIFGWCQSRFSMIFPFNYGYFFWGDFPMKIHFPMVFPMSTRKSPWSPSCRMIVARWRRVETKFRNAFWHSVTWSPKKQGFTARKHGKLRISSPKIWRWGYNGLWMGLGIIYVYRYLYNSKWI